jgi:prolipoprotein diacylglyceryltransferase
VFGFLVQYARTESIGYRYGFQITSLIMFVIGLVFWVSVRSTKRSQPSIKPEEQVSITING